MPSEPLRVGIAQVKAAAGDVAANVARAADAIGELAAKGAHLVAFPELFLTGYEPALLAANGDLWFVSGDARLEPIRQACAAAGVTAILGAPLRTSEGAKRIAAPIVGPQGDVGASTKEYVHGSEASLFAPGAPLPPFEVHGWRVGVGICFDTAHPRHAEAAARAGADLYVSSALYWEGEERRSDLHLGARAMDNRIFSVLANYAGTTGGYRSCGGSGAWAPTGEVRARQTGAGEALLLVELDPAELTAFRGG
ncbi:MAG TPA: carbon-nitrogen hydrolase family protein [Polyangiaceae bacterium]|jgi:predicted amidohydrolase